MSFNNNFYNDSRAYRFFYKNIDPFFRYRFDDTDVIDLEGSNFVMFDEPKYFVQVLHPIMVRTYFSLKSVKQFGINYVYLNPEIDSNQLSKLMFAYIVPKKDMLEVKGIFNEVLQLRERGGITPSRQMKRNYILNKNLSKSKMYKARGEANGILRSRKNGTKELLYEILCAWDERKFTYRELADMAGVSYSTVKKYAPELKEQIEAIKARPEQNKDEKLEKIKASMYAHDLTTGVPTYQDTADATGYSLRTVESYGKSHLKQIKSELKEKRGEIVKP